MVVIQRKSKRKSTGGRYRSGRGTRRFEMGRRPPLTKLEETKNKVIKTKGGGTKIRLLTSKTANLLDTKTNKHVKATIETVIEKLLYRQPTVIMPSDFEILNELYKKLKDDGELPSAEEQIQEEDNGKYGTY